MQYLGYLPTRDPMFGYLRDTIQPLLGAHRDVQYRVFRCNASNDVYLYEEKNSGTRVIGKFFLTARMPDSEAAEKRARREFANLTEVRGLGFDRPPHCFARPLGVNPELNELLCVEFCDGVLLSEILHRTAAGGGAPRELYDKLTALAWFLAELHNRTAEESQRVDFAEACRYFDTVTDRLRRQGLDDGGELRRLRDRWGESEHMNSDRRVLVHGDATPENFRFGRGLEVFSFDLERMRRADRVFDLGRIAGELAHGFLLPTGSRSGAEPFIGHFLWEYACHFPDRDGAFAAITRRIPFYMGSTLLRIARNDWLDWDYRRRLVAEAKNCLQREIP